MKKISSTFANNHEYIARPFALVKHEHTEYFPLDATATITITTPVIFEGAVLIGGVNTAVLYTNATPMPEDFGGLPQGRTFDNESIESVLDDLLYPYVAISSNSLGANIGNSLRELGDTITAGVTFTANYTLGSDPLVDITFKRGGIVQQVDTINTWVENTNIAATTSFSVDVNDGTTISSSSRTYSFVYPFYYGVGAPSLTPAQIRSNFGATITSSGDKTYGFTPTSEVYYFAYPVSYGTLTRVLDWNGFDITADFTLRTETLVGLDASSQSYYIYEFNNLVTHAAQNLTFDT